MLNVFERWYKRKFSDPDSMMLLLLLLISSLLLAVWCVCVSCARALARSLKVCVCVYALAARGRSLARFKCVFVPPDKQTSPVIIITIWQTKSCF